jgi:hypothetical protein
MLSGSLQHLSDFLTLSLSPGKPFALGATFGFSYLGGSGSFPSELDTETDPLSDGFSVLTEGQIDCCGAFVGAHCGESGSLMERVMAFSTTN